MSVKPIGAGAQHPGVTPHPPALRERARQLYVDEGLTAEATAQRLSLSTMTVRSWARRGKWRSTQHAVRATQAVASKQTASEFVGAQAKSVHRFLQQTIADCNALRSKGMSILEHIPDDSPRNYYYCVQGVRETVEMARKVYGLDKQESGPQTLVNISIPMSRRDPMGNQIGIKEPIDI